MKKYFANKNKVENFDGIENKIIYIRRAIQKKSLLFFFWVEILENTKSTGTIEWIFLVGIISGQL